MPYDGSGVFSRLYDWADDKVNGIYPNASRMDADMDDMVDGLNNILLNDGTTLPTADIPWSSNKITGLADGASRDDAITIDQVQNSETIQAADTTNTDDYEATLTPAITAYAEGMMVVLRATNANTGATTLNLNSIGAKAVQLRGTALNGGEIQAGKPALLVYDGTQFQLVAATQWWDSSYVTLETGANANTGLGKGHYAATLSGAADNSALGRNALAALTSGDNNVAAGVQAGDSQTTVGNHTFAGYLAGEIITTVGDDEVGVGYNAGPGIAALDASDTVMVGSESGPSGGGISGVCVGYTARSDYRSVAIGDASAGGSGLGVAIGNNASTTAASIVVAVSAVAGAGGILAIGSTNYQRNIQTTVGSAGVASALPSNPTGYIEIDLDSTAYPNNVVIPYYAAS